MIDAVTDYYRDMNANSGGAFTTSEASDSMAAEAHAALATALASDRAGPGFGRGDGAGGLHPAPASVGHSAE